MFLSGIDIGGTSIKFGIFDEQLNLLQQWSRPTPKEPAEAAALIAAQLEPYHVAAIGAGAPGTLNAARETITADNLAWVDVPLAALLRRASGLPAVVINDGHAAMLAEMRSGALQNVQTGILLTLGTGIGGGHCHQWAVLAQPHRAGPGTGAYHHPQRRSALPLRPVRLL